MLYKRLDVAYLYVVYIKSGLEDAGCETKNVKI